MLQSILVLIAFFLGIAGMICSSEATLGVAIISWACLFGIFARLAQAEAHHKELIKIAEK